MKIDQTVSDSQVINTLEIKALSKTYPNGVEALRSIDLTIGNGMFGLLGPNGAGKSTLMRILSTLEEPSSGSVVFNRVNIDSDPHALRSRLGYLPQEFGVYPRVSAYRLLDHLAILKGVKNRSHRKEQVEALLALTNLYPMRKRAVSTFSGGMRQRFGIAQAMLGDPSLLIVDEPTAGLDPEERHRFYNLLSEVGEHVIVILSTHIVEDVSNLCARVAIMANGSLLADSPPAKLMAQLENKVWSKMVDKHEIQLYRDNFNILSERRVAGEIQINIWSEKQPDSGFHLVKPDLEDVYFSSLSSQTRA